MTKNRCLHQESWEKRVFIFMFVTGCFNKKRDGEFGLYRR